jgi:hypothetical protein
VENTPRRVLVVCLLHVLLRVVFSSSLRHNVVINALLRRLRQKGALLAARSARRFVQAEHNRTREAGARPGKAAPPRRATRVKDVALVIVKEEKLGPAAPLSSTWDDCPSLLPVPRLFLPTECREGGPELGRAQTLCVDLSTAILVYQI